MRILITGISGFIGSAVYKKFKVNGHAIYAIDNLSFGNRDLIDISPENFYVEDIRNRSNVLDIFDKVKPDWVIHLAAIHFIPYCNAHPFEASLVNIQGTKNILDACATSESVKKVFYASTAAVYPIMEGPIGEDTEPGPTDIYGLSKLAGEYLCHAFHETTKIPTLVCRFFNAFGPNETNPHLIPVIQDQVNDGLRVISLGNLEPKRDFIHTSDMAKAIDLLLQKFDAGIDTFNLGSGVEYSVKEIVEAFEYVIGEKIIIQQDPGRMRKSDRMHLLSNITKLSSFIDWKPNMGISEGIKTLVKL